MACSYTADLDPPGRKGRERRFLRRGCPDTSIPPPTHSGHRQRGGSEVRSGSRLFPNTANPALVRHTHQDEISLAIGDFAVEPQDPVEQSDAMEPRR